MSWIRECTVSWLQLLCVNVVKSGSLPKHVAFIMDGNRRYAHQTNLGKTVGHIKGFDKLAETLQWCLCLGIKEVTYYVFSIENFKRSPEEVDFLMELARQKFKKLLNEKDKLMEHGVCIRVIGNLSLLPQDVQQLIAEIRLLTAQNNQAFLNLAIAYTGREEMTQAIKSVVTGIEQAALEMSDVNQKLLGECLYTSKSPDPELLIRTSGEVRLSDFLLWQISCSYIYFLEVMWPEFTVWHMLAAVLKYQRNAEHLAPVRHAEEAMSGKLSEQASSFLEYLSAPQK